MPAQCLLLPDIYCRWTGHSLGGLPDHVSYPDGSNCETFPGNAGQAEARHRIHVRPSGQRSG